MKRTPTATSALSFKSLTKALAPKNNVDTDLEKALLAACAEGDVEKSRQVVEKIQRKVDTTAKEAIEELFACAFARAAGCNHVAMMEFLLMLDIAFPPLEFAMTALRYGVCRFEIYFPPVGVLNNNRMQCCWALRYVGYAAIMCVEHNTLSALRFLIERGLLEDVEVVRCFTFAKLKAIRFDAPNPGAYRPMLMLLITKFPCLLQICSTNTRENPIDQLRESEAQRHMKALESSLVYEYKVN